MIPREQIVEGIETLKSELDELTKQNPTVVGALEVRTRLLSDLSVLRWMLSEIDGVAI